MNAEQPIGVFDSGVGGISVLREIAALLPAEDYIYYGDSANAPYGVRPTEEIRRLTTAVFEKLIAQGVKAIVIACNTASSAAGEYLREKYPQLPIIAIEPALKPAVLSQKHGTVLVLATAATLREHKFQHLMKLYEDQAEILDFACPEIVEAVEQGAIDSPALRASLTKRFAAVRDRGVRSIVLGCTHYPFVRRMIQEIAGPEVGIFDGAAGTARQLARQLEDWNLLRAAGRQGKISWQNSSSDPALLELSRKLFTLLE